MLTSRSSISRCAPWTRMSSLKPLKSVAHSLAHYFASTLNYWGNDYAINHLARIAKSSNTSKVELDVLNSNVTPELAELGLVTEMVVHLKSKLESILEKEAISISLLSSVKITYSFDSPSHDLIYELPTYECVSKISTFSGRKYEAFLTETSN